MTRGGGATDAGAGAWLELSVAADIEAVEAVAEILGRVRPAGTSVEPAFELVDEGLGARSTRRGRRSSGRICPRAIGRRQIARPPRQPRRSGISRRSASGRSAS